MPQAPAPDQGSQMYNISQYPMLNVLINPTKETVSRLSESERNYLNDAIGFKATSLAIINIAASYERGRISESQFTAYVSRLIKHVLKLKNSFIPEDALVDIFLPYFIRTGRRTISAISMETRNILSKFNIPEEHKNRIVDDIVDYMTASLAAIAIEQATAEKYSYLDNLIEKNLVYSYVLPATSVSHYLISAMPPALVDKLQEYKNILRPPTTTSPQSQTQQKVKQPTGQQTTRQTSQPPPKKEKSPQQG